MQTPMSTEKAGSKKQNFAMTPDIHTKTYAERSGLGMNNSGLTGTSPAIHLQTSAVSGGGYHTTAYGSIHQSAKTTKNL